MSADAKIGPHPGQLSMWSHRAVEAMKNGKPGDGRTVEEMTAAVGRDCSPSGGRGYASVQSAIRHLLHTQGIVWRWSREHKAWRCLTPAEAANYSGDTLTAARRRARRSIKIGSVVDRNKLNEDEKRNLDLTMAQAGIMQLAGSSSVRKQLSALPAVKDVDQKQLLDLFR